MRISLICALIFVYFNPAASFSKYGRTCKDIDCLSNQVCVIENDPCSYYSRESQCGPYPTCKNLNNAPAPSCATYVCPPTKVCKMDGSTPKCVDDHSKSSHVGYDTSSLNQPSAPVDPGRHLYPTVPRGETTPRPNVYRQPAGQGYAGGQIGSGYPGQARPNYPQQTPQGRYPHQGQGYPGQAYPGQAYPGGYPGQGAYPGQGGYPGQGAYPGQGGYPGQGAYPGQGYAGQGNYPNGRNSYGSRYGSRSEGSSILDSLSESLKKIGTKLLADTIANKLRGVNNNNPQ